MVAPLVRSAWSVDKNVMHRKKTIEEMAAMNHWTKFKMNRLAYAQNTGSGPSNVDIVSNDRHIVVSALKHNWFVYGNLSSFEIHKRYIEYGWHFWPFHKRRNVYKEVFIMKSSEQTKKCIPEKWSDNFTKKTKHEETKSKRNEWIIQMCVRMKKQ